MARISVFACLMLSAIGCAKKDSDDLDTSEIYAEISLRPTGGRTYVSADLTTRADLGTTGVDLVPGDKLVAYAAGQSSVISRFRDPITGDIEYQTHFDFDTGGTEFTIAFERDSRKGAPESTITLPGTIDITAPPADTSFQSSDTIDVTWTVTEGSLSLTVEAGCPTSGGHKTVTHTSSTDDSSESIAVQALLDNVTSNGAYSLTGDCDGWISMRRSTRGKLDPEYRGGRITALRLGGIGFSIAN